MDIKQYLEEYQTVVAAYEDLEDQRSDISVLSRTAKKRREKKSLEKQDYKLIHELHSAKADVISVLEKYVRSLVIVPGDENRFKQLANYEVEVVDLGLLNKGVFVYQTKSSIPSYRFNSIKDYRTQIELMLKNQVVGLVETQFLEGEYSSMYDSSDKRFYGLPVRRKEMK